LGPTRRRARVARILRDNGISAAPVVDAAGAPSGMVSEGGLIGRDEARREARRDWWLTPLADGGRSLAILAPACAPRSDGRDVMAEPVVTVGEETEISEIAQLLTAHRIKRLPLLRDGRIVGIVSRADLVGALAADKPRPTAASRGGSLAEARPGSIVASSTGSIPPSTPGQSSRRAPRLMPDRRCRTFAV